MDNDDRDRRRSGPLPYWWRQFWGMGGQWRPRERRRRLDWWAGLGLLAIALSAALMLWLCGVLLIGDGPSPSNSPDIPSIPSHQEGGPSPANAKRWASMGRSSGLLTDGRRSAPAAWWWCQGIIEGGYPIAGHCSWRRHPTPRGAPPRRGPWPLGPTMTRVSLHTPYPVREDSRVRL